MDNRSGGGSAPNDSSVSSIRETAVTNGSQPHTPSTLAASVSVSATAPGYSSFQNVPATMMDIDKNTLAEDRSRRATSVLSMDDIEAAQALEGLRTEYGQPPRNVSQQISNPDSKAPPEPLLSLLTSTHPLISSAINGSMSAYTSSKSYSPRFKSGAEFIERNIGSPVASTVGTVGRKTGVESSLRWALQRRGSNFNDPKRSKRRKVSGDKHPSEVDLEKGSDDTMSSRRVRSSSDLSMGEPLPPYDDQKTPSYEEVDREGASRQNPTWQSRLMISTSGLGVAMSEESLRSLQYCLTWLKWANGRLGKAILALQGALKEWDNEDSSSSQDSSLLTQRIQAVKEDVLSTLKQVVDIVSKYAGGALPENARNLVRRHLTSLPHRFQVASTSNPPPDSTAASSEATVGAHRILVLAQEGLDMMAQVSGVVNDTLVSAELWCRRLGKKRSDSKDASEASQPSPHNATFPADVKQPIREGSQDVPMTGTEEKV
ncbi:Opi1-domain-containing protein [Aspergillus avenaceus]|uniref:Opi1-domain-containing protein n=1 Tax=Aspergillus avenaceus TaxID=36643 RepID=A0A5N6U866_ASPAV|nr:Opi1-domain-containing protein [Aspergillus avenaceus]